MSNWKEDFDKKTIGGGGMTWEEAKEFIENLRLQDRDELIKMLKDSFIPAESSRGQGGLPQYGTVKDWTITLTKEGFEIMLKKFEDYFNK